MAIGSLFLIRYDTGLFRVTVIILSLPLTFRKKPAQIGVADGDAFQFAATGIILLDDNIAGRIVPAHRGDDAGDIRPAFTYRPGRDYRRSVGYIWPLRCGLHARIAAPAGLSMQERLRASRGHDHGLSFGRAR